MKVKLKNTWFAPTEERVINPVITTSGKRYDKGVHEIEERYRDDLPRSAEILEDAYVEPEVEVAVDTRKLTDFDVDRANGDALAEAAKEGQK